MKRVLNLLILALLSVATPTMVEAADGGQNSDIPHLAEVNGIKRLIVDGEPFVVIGGELHNSTGSCEAYFAPMFPALKALNLNTIITTIGWDQFEPREGEYNFEQIDAQIRHAEMNDLKLVVCWFATWKNGKSSYLPMWIKRDQKKYMRAKAADGGTIEQKPGMGATNIDRHIDVISTLCEATREADARAFAALMRHIKEVDKNRCVIMMQVENEVGLFGDMDYCKSAQKAYNSDVPERLCRALGVDKRGSWVEVFGDNPHTKEKFLAWNYAKYIDKVAQSGKAEYDIPMYVNAWVVQKDGDLPGVYPNGGPVAHVMDIYRAAAPNIDLFSPDIYLPEYKEILAKYDKDDNVIFVPEARLSPDNLFYTIANKNAIGFSPFGIEDGIGDFLYARSAEVLQQILPQLMISQELDRVVAVAKNGDESSQTVVLGDQEMEVLYISGDQPCFGIIMLMEDGSLMVAGMNLRINFKSSDHQKVTLVGSFYEGNFNDKGEWVAGRLLNGDEGCGYTSLQLKGKVNYTMEIDQTIDPNRAVAPNSYSANRRVVKITPAIYKIELYELDNRNR